MPSRDALTRQVDRFLDHLTVERGLSPHTVAAYRRDLTRYAAFLRDREVTDVRKVDERLVTSFIAAISAATYGNGTRYRSTSVVRALSSVRSFERFLLREGLVSRDPTAAVVRPKLPRSLPKPLSVDDVARLLEQPDRSAPGRVTLSYPDSRTSTWRRMCRAHPRASSRRVRQRSAVEAGASLPANVALRTAPVLWCSLRPERRGASSERMIRWSASCGDSR